MSYAFRKRFDPSIIEPDASDDEVVRFVEKCKQFPNEVAAVALNLHQLPLAIELLRDTDIHAVGMVAYPFGGLPTELKVAQAEHAVKRGARQIDMCMAFGGFRSGKYDLVKKDVEAVVEAVRGKVSAISVIPNTAYLTNEEKLLACEIIRDAGADFVKTNTGFGLVTKPEEVRLIREKMGDTIKIIASGGVRNLEQALAMLEAGADRIATSTPFQIFDEWKAARRLGGAMKC